MVVFDDTQDAHAEKHDELQLAATQNFLIHQQIDLQTCSSPSARAEKKISFSLSIHHISALDRPRTSCNR